MNWTLKLVPKVTDPAVFVVGEYGPKTEETVLAFRRHYDIHWPPSAPAGTYSGSTGPRTLRVLDALCARFDASVAAIEAKVGKLQASGLGVALTFEPPPFHPISKTEGVYRTAEIESTDGAILHHRDAGAFEVHGWIYTAYVVEHEFASGPLGFPISDEHDDGPGFRRSDFQHGSIRCSLKTGAVELLGTPSPRPINF